jgi:hypothetical protein
MARGHLQLPIAADIPGAVASAAVAMDASGRRTFVRKRFPAAKSTSPSAEESEDSSDDRPGAADGGRRSPVRRPSGGGVGGVAAAARAAGAAADGRRRLSPVCRHSGGGAGGTCSAPFFWCFLFLVLFVFETQFHRLQDFCCDQSSNLAWNTCLFLFLAQYDISVQQKPTTIGGTI